MTRTILIRESLFLRLKHNYFWIKADKIYNYSKCNGVVVLHITFNDFSLDKLLTKFSFTSEDNYATK